MRTANRLLYLLASFLLGYNWAYSQTQADVRMGEILNSGDLFLLKEEYPNLKDSVSVKMLDFMVEAQFGIDFNRLENAAVVLDRGQHIYIPVEVNGATKSYIFDTGCSFGNFVSEKYAEEVGLKIAADLVVFSDIARYSCWLQCCAALFPSRGLPPAHLSP